MMSAAVVQLLHQLRRKLAAKVQADARCPTRQPPDETAYREATYRMSEASRGVSSGREAAG